MRLGGAGSQGEQSEGAGPRTLSGAGLSVKGPLLMSTCEYFSTCVSVTTQPEATWMYQMSHVPSRFAPHSSVKRHWTALVPMSFKVSSRYSSLHKGGRCLGNPRHARHLMSQAGMGRPCQGNLQGESLAWQDCPHILKCHARPWTCDGDRTGGPQTCVGMGLGFGELARLRGTKLTNEMQLHVLPRHPPLSHCPLCPVTCEE